MSKHIPLTLLGLIILPGLALADDWKDESGQGKRGYYQGWGERHSEPPDWARGKGVWDGHFKHGRPPAYEYRVYPAPDRFYPQYAPPVPYPPRWGYDRDDRKEWKEDHRERLKDQREREKEAYKDWAEDRRERLKDLREREKEFYKDWR